MSGNTEREVDFPKCECSDDNYWYVVYSGYLDGLCFHPEKSLAMRDNHKIYDMKTRNLQKSELKNIKTVKCTNCQKEASKEEFERIIHVAEIIFERELKKYERKY